MSGFYEWQAVGKIKQPWHIWRKDGDPIAFAGFYNDAWRLCTMTTDPNAEMAAIRERMPVIVVPDQWERYLDPQITDHDEVAQMHCPLPDGSLTLQAVSRYVSNAHIDGPDALNR